MADYSFNFAKSILFYIFVANYIYTHGNNYWKKTGAGRAEKMF